jgi:predicted phosphodiesterase
MTLAVIGDIHLNKLSHRIPNFNELVLKTLRSTLDDVEKRGVGKVVLAGDIFDDPYPSQTSNAQFLDALTDYPDMEFLAIIGNHDYADASTNSMVIANWTRKLKSNLRIVSEPEILKVDGVRYELMPHPYVQDMSRKADFGIAHFAVNGARGDNGYVVRTKNQPKGNWILGDFHTEQQGKIKGCLYDYVGSLTQLAWEEAAKKSIIIVEDGEKHRRRVNLAYKLVKYVVSSDDELDDCKFEANCFYHMKLKGGYVLPKGWALEHPTVVKQSAVGKKKDPRAALLAEDSPTLLHPLANLEAYLLTKKIDPVIAQRAVDLAHTLRLVA